LLALPFLADCITHTPDISLNLIKGCYIASILQFSNSSNFYFLHKSTEHDGSCRTSQRQAGYDLGVIELVDGDNDCGQSCKKTHSTHSFIQAD